MKNIASFTRRSLLAQCLGYLALSATAISAKAAPLEQVATRPNFAVPAKAAASCQRYPLGSRGRASVIVSGYNDGKFSAFFQERARLDRATYGYSKVVLLRPKAQLRWIEPSVERRADYREEPTEANLVKYLKYLTDEGYTIDIWIHSHGNSGGATLYDANGNSFKLSTTLIERLPPQAGYAKLPIGLVYHVSCWGADLTPAWVKIGANCAVGPRGVNFYPTQFSTFVGQWNDGETARASQDRANSWASRQVIQKYFLAEAFLTRGTWGGAFPKTIITDIGYKPKKFFDYHFGFTLPEWDYKATGAHNMGMGSEMLYAGNRYYNKKTNWRNLNPSATVNVLQH